MSKYTKNLIVNFVGIIVLVAVAFINWMKPLYLWFGDSPITRFIWLGLFFVILDIILEVVSRSLKDMRLIMEVAGLAKDIKKISAGFHVVPKFVSPTKLKADYVVVGSSGVWLIAVKDDWGKITFNGDEIMQDGVVLAGAVTNLLEKSYSLAAYFKEKTRKDIKVAPVIAFSSFKADLNEMPKAVRGVFISSRKDIVALMENTDFQLIDKNTIEEIYNILKK